MCLLVVTATNHILFVMQTFWEAFPAEGGKARTTYMVGSLILKYPPAPLRPSLQIQPLLDCRPSLHLSLAVGTSILVCRPLPLQFAYSDAEPERPTFEALLDR